MANVLDVASYILDQTGYVSTMKLQKLTFYSQAYSPSPVAFLCFRRTFKHG